LISQIQVAPAPSPVQTPLSRFSVTYRGKSLGEFEIHVPGRHNVLNATAAIAVGIGLDIAPDAIRQALREFRGVDRRFELKGSTNGIDVIDDYGHHPTEIRATLAAARQCGYKRVHVIFQPHRYTRTQLLIDEFASAFADADTVSILDIYPASEQPILGVTGEWLARRITEASGRKADYISSFADAAAAIARDANSGEMVLTLGAGNVSQLGAQILDAVANRTESKPEHEGHKVRSKDFV
jgi:UDP-N-acetylmuramate--alanine ligase